MTSIETGPSWSERLNPRNWTLAWKLVIVGLVPALLALSLGILRISDQAGAAAELGQSSRLLDVRQEVAGAADALRQERDEAVLFVAGNRTGDRGVLDIGSGQTDGAVRDALAAVRAAGGLDAATAGALAQADSGVGKLTDLRKDVTDSPNVDATQIRDRYTDTISGVDVLDRALLRQLRAPDTAGLADALTATRAAAEQLALQHTVLGAALRSGQLSPDDATILGGTDPQLQAQLQLYQVALTPEQLARFGNFLGDPADADRQRLVATALASAPGRPLAIAPAEWDSAYNGSRTAVDRSSDLIRQDLVAASAAAEESASNLAGINSVILMLGLLIGITIAILVARALIRSLRVLRTAALDVAERRLPQAVESMRAGETPDVTVDPVPLDSRDEVGQVARAFDAVHGQAVRLAADQAALQSNVSAMFVNLSRRSQALVERQLQLIEQLESNEQDADQLSNLFQLDHLATRMRRNSENLLVLAGTDLAKRNIAPVPMVDVLRAAVSEIEQYQRIVVQAPPTATIVGRAGSDLVHLLAELLDNATNFSPPDSQVVMSTTRTSDGSIVVEIADRGVGMIDHELSDANQRLGGPSTVDVSASRRMGLFVVGRLGARHGIGVRLSTSAGGGPAAGLTASVTVPAYLIPSAEPSESDKPLGMPVPAAVPAQGGSDPSAPQRADANGSGRPGSLSALVAGTDGPANPAGIFDAPARPDTDAPRFTTPPANGTSNGTSNGLPSRRPGSSLRPAGPPPPERPEQSERSGSDEQPEPAERSDAERLAGEREAREVADQARRDQEAAAERAAQARAAQREQGARQDNPDRPDPESDQPVAGRNGIITNGVRPLAPQQGPRPPATPTPAEAEPRDERARPEQAAEEAAPAPADAQRSDTSDERSAENERTSQPEQQPSTPQRADRPQAAESFPADAEFGNGAATPQEPAAVRPPVAPSPPTTPMPMVGRQAPPAPPRPAEADQPRTDQPRTDQQSGPRPELQQPAPRPAAALPVRHAPAGPPAAARQPDALFAPNVPVIAEPGQASPAAEQSEQASRQQRGFELGETTPIFEEIASAWFRSNRPVPVNWETDDDEAGRPAEAGPTPAPQAAAPAAPPVAPLPVSQPPVSPPVVGPPPISQAPVSPPPAPAPTPTPRPAPRPAQVERPAPPVAPPVPEREPAPVASDDRSFAGAADEGWRAAGDIESARPDELTPAGLPKRRPRARLVPGSAGSAVLAPPVSAARSAETIRGRLASYQQGVRQGRESRSRDAGTATDTSTNPAQPGSNHDEEST